MRFLLAGLLLACSMSSVAAETPVVEPAAPANPGYFTSFVVASSLYEQDVSVETELNTANTASVSNRLSAVIPVQDCGQLLSDVNLVLTPAKDRNSATVDLTINNEAINGTSCENQALTLVSPIKARVTVEVGTSTLKVKVPNQENVFEITVLYVPEELAEKT